MAAAAAGVAAVVAAPEVSAAPPHTAQ